MTITATSGLAAPTHTPGGNATTVLASPALGARDLLVIHQEQAPGGMNPMHSKSTDAVVIALEGELEVVGTDESRRLCRGDSALIAAGTLHQLRNATDVAASWLVVTPGDVTFRSGDGEVVQPGWAR